MDLIYTKDVDKSLLYQGFTIRYSLLNHLLNKVGRLEIGKSRPLSIMLNGKVYNGITLINQNFDRKKYSDHVEMYQVRYSEQSDFAKALRKTFVTLSKFIENQWKINRSLGIKKVIKIPEDMRCSVAFYETDLSNVWEAVPIFTNDYKEAIRVIKDYATTEINYENILLRDEDAHIVEEQHLIKVRKLDRNVCQNLKKLYEFRCQVCGQLITSPYTNGDEKVIDAHHIIPFTESCNNNFSNIMILCPNHHRVIHACHPVFKIKQKEFIYPNGYREKLVLNKHL